ncbi:MAG: molecular chaperone Tir [Methanosarcinales archaeon]|nr:molecular chaperone Tir [Methanosarcinales archaeon]
MKTYNIFISHSWNYSDTYKKLRTLLKKKKYFSFKDYSVPRDDPIHNAPNSNELYEAIKRQISPCHVVLIPAGVYVTYSTWINNEIHIAKNEFQGPKPIIAIRPWAQTNISTVVKENADEIVGWNTDSVVGAIRKHS